MSFRLCVLIICIAIASALTIGCAKENEPTRQPFVVSFGEKGSCFKNIPETFQRYFDSDLGDAEIQSFWVCAQSAIETFVVKVSGEKSRPDVFTPGELNKFLSDNFLSSQPLPDSLMNSLMDLKVAWFGGSNLQLTKKELRQLQVWFAEFSNVMLALKSHVPVYMGQKAEFSSEQLLGAEMQLILAAQKIGALPALQGKAMGSASLQKFLSELERYLSTGVDDSPVKALSEMLPMVLNIKKMMFGTPEEIIAVGDWKNLLSVGAQGFMIFRQARYGVLESSIEKPLWIRSVDHIFSQVANVVLPVFQRRKGEPITEAEWQRLFEQFEKSNLTDFKAQQIMQVYLTVHSLLKAPGTTSNDFHQEDFLNILNEVALWKDAHNKIIAGDSYDKSSGYEAFFADLEIKNKDLQLDKNGEWLLPAPSAKLDLRSRLHLNWRAFVAWRLLNKYGDPSVGWTMDQLRPLQQSLSSLFEEKYLVKVFREANLFTLAGDGNDVLSPTEAIQYLSLVLSGISSSTRIQTFSPDLSVMNIQKAIWDNKENIFAHTPLLLGSLKDQKTWQAVNRLLMATVKDQGSLKNPWTSWELAQSQILILYLEGFMKRFDLNQDQVIDHDEALGALEIFGPILGQLLGKIGVGPKELPSFFLFMIRYGDTPFTLYGGDVLYTYWKWNPSAWASIRADRQTLLSILATLAKL